MGKIFLPKWDSKESDRTHIATYVGRKYLGYGYWIIFYSDGTKTLFRERQSPECFLPLSKCEKFDDEGFPQWV